MPLYRSERNTRWKSSKSVAPPPTAYTPGPNWLIFCRETPHVNAFRGTEAIFEFHPRSRDMGTFWGFRVVKLGVKNWWFSAYISAPRMKFKNRLGAPESIHMRGLSPKNELIRPRRLGCRGGCYGFWRLFTLYFTHFCIPHNESYFRFIYTICTCDVTQINIHTAYMINNISYWQKTRPRWSTMRP